MAACEDDEQGTSLTSLCLIFSPMLSISPTFPLRAPPRKKRGKLLEKETEEKRRWGKLFLMFFFDIFFLSFLPLRNASFFNRIQHFFLSLSSRGRAV